MSNLISNDSSAVQSRVDPTQHVNSNHTHFTRLSREMKISGIARFKVLDFKNLPAIFRIFYYVDQMPRKILEKQKEELKISFKTNRASNFPQRLENIEVIDQKSKHLPTLHVTATLHSKKMVLLPHLCTGVKK